MSLPRMLARPLVVLGAVVALALLPTAARAASCSYEGTGVPEQSGDCFSTRTYFSCLEDDGSLNMCYDTVEGCFTDDGRWWTLRMTSLGGDCFPHG